MSYNILNKGVKFQGDTQGTIENMVDTHSTQTINGLKTITHLTGTHVRVTNDATVLGNVSASINISASAFYGDGSTLSNVGVVSSVSNGSNNRVATFTSTDALNGEAMMTFDGTTRTLTVGGTEDPATQSGSIVFHYGQISGSGNISGSAFYGSGEGLTGIPGAALSLASGGGITDSSGLKLDASVSTVGSLSTSDKILLFDADDGDNVKRTTAGAIANLFDPAVSTFNGDVNNRVLTAGGSEIINGEANMTFDGSILTVVGDFSGSGFVSASNVVVAGEGTVTAGGISLSSAGGLAGNGLFNSSGKLEVQVTGAIHTVQLAAPRYHVGITGSIAGNGLSFGGGVNSISSLAVNLDSNSGLAVSTSGIKTNFAGLATATPVAASDNLTFIDSDGDKKCSFETFLTAIAGANLGVSGSQLTASAGGSVDIDALSALGGTGLHQTQDHFMFSDNGTEKKITFSNLEDAIFGNVSGDATIAAGGAVTIADNAVSLAKMAGLARGKIIIGDSSGDPSALTLGSAGQLLVSDGDDLLYRTVGGDASLGADGTLTIAANAVEGSMLNSNVAGSGLDYTSNELRVDVSDFMTNGSNNRIVTATGTDGMNAEQNLTFDGSLLTGTNITSSFTHYAAGNIAGIGDTQAGYYNASGSNTDAYLQFNEQGNVSPLFAVAGTNHPSIPGLIKTLCTLSSSADVNVVNITGSGDIQIGGTARIDGGSLSINGAEGGAGAYRKIIIRKTSIADNSATAVVRFTIPNANHAAGFKVFGFVTTDSGSRVGTFEQDIAISRVAGSIAAHAGTNREESARANSGGSGADFTISSDLTQAGGASASNTLDYELTIDTTDGSSTNAVISIELLNFNSTGITMAPV